MVEDFKNLIVKVEPVWQSLTWQCSQTPTPRQTQLSIKAALYIMLTWLYQYLTLIIMHTIFKVHM